MTDNTKNDQSALNPLKCDVPHIPTHTAGVKMQSLNWLARVGTLEQGYLSIQPSA